VAKVIELATAPPLRRKPPALPVPRVLQEVPEVQAPKPHRYLWTQLAGSPNIQSCWSRAWPLRFPF